MATADDITQTQKALVVALELLRNQVQDNALALAANTQRVGALMSWYAYHVEQFANGNTSASSQPATPPATAAASGPGGPTPAKTAASGTGAAPVVNVVVNVTPPAPGAPGGPMPTATPVATPVMPTATPVATVIETAEQRKRRQEKEDEKKRAQARAKTMEDAKQAISPLTKVFAMAGAKFAAVAGPLAMLAQVLSATTSGFQTLEKASRLVGSAFAPVLLPAVLMLATSFTAVAELLGEFGPEMQQFFEVMIDILLPAITQSIDAFVLLAAITKDTASLFKELGNAAAFWTTAIGGRGSDASRRRVDSSMRDVLESFRRSIGPKAQISGLAEVGKQAQLAALNQDPLEARLMKQQLDVLNRLLAAVERRRGMDMTPRVHDPVRSGDDFRGAALHTGAGLLRSLLRVVI